MPTLPPNAFIPRSIFTDPKPKSFTENRDRYFALCTPAEQGCLLRLATWYGARYHRPWPMSTIFSDSYFAEFKRRNFPWMGLKPRAATRVLAKAWTTTVATERWLGKRLQDRFLAQLEAMRARGEDEVLLGVANYFRALPLAFNAGVHEAHAFGVRLEELADGCAQNTRIDPRVRIASLIRSVRGAPDRTEPSRLQRQLWKALLELAEQDADAAVALIDTHWISNAEPGVLRTLYLHEAPELAFHLAQRCHAQRPVFAAEMTRDALLSWSHQRDKLDEPARVQLEQRMDAACRQLSAWRGTLPPDNVPASLRAIDTLLWHGNPADDYWPALPGAALARVRQLDRPGQIAHLNLIARTAFYANPGSAEEKEGLELFAACIGQGLTQSTPTVYEICNAISLLENKIRSYRNRRIAARPEHPLLHLVASHVEAELAHKIAQDPGRALQHSVAIALALSNQTLIRQQHALLRAQFEARARACPADAGKALEALIRSLASSKASDEMVRQAICQESFDLLLPVLARISPADAAVARAGIGWDPRRDYM